jgi:hypothetical protein
MLIVIMLNVVFSYCYVECCYFEYHYTESRYAECRDAVTAVKLAYRSLCRRDP